MWLQPRRLEKSLYLYLSALDFKINKEVKIEGFYFARKTKSQELWCSTAKQQSKWQLRFWSDIADHYQNVIYLQFKNKILECLFSSVCQTLSFSHSCQQRKIGLEETSKKPSIVSLFQARIKSVGQSLQMFATLFFQIWRLYLIFR